MVTPKNAASKFVQKPRNSGGGRSTRRRVPQTDRGEAHIGATEDQISVTMPPKADDDEPKQG
jgi:hypothetical protein